MTSTGSTPAASAPPHGGPTGPSYQAVEQVIRAIHEHLEEPLTLLDLADIAGLSPFHFNRLFRRITGVPPCHFLAALRMEAAKRLLLTTGLNVTEICLTVGYQSLGSFTTHFTRFVGISPSRFRALALQYLHGTPSWLSAYVSATPPAEQECGMAGQVQVSEDFSGFVAVGLFGAAIPQERPSACCLLAQPGSYQLPCLPDGEHYVFAVAFAWMQDPLCYLLPGGPAVRVSNQRVVGATGGRVDGPVDLTLRPMRLTDPPILIALPLLLMERAGHNHLQTAQSPRNIAKLAAL
ncbi:MAG TPA: AraC family transcriptional regulator [Roseiflexaceae bacterium]|nr:AraC family transcriptional regulator [Roseiflexaceae bacterium]